VFARTVRDWSIHLSTVPGVRTVAQRRSKSNLRRPAASNISEGIDGSHRDCLAGAENLHPCIAPYGGLLDGCVMTLGPLSDAATSLLDTLKRHGEGPNREG